MPQSKHPYVAVFDFDGTLTTSDSFLRFVTAACGGFGKLVFRVVAGLPCLAARACREPSRDGMKEALLKVALGGRTRADLEGHAERFAADILPRLERPALLERLKQHQRHGHRIILLSASLELYLRPWAAMRGIEEILATRLEYDSQSRFTGRLEGKNCRGAEKLRRLEAHLGDLSAYAMISYGDAPSDKHVFRRSVEAYFVSPDSTLRKFTNE